MLAKKKYILVLLLAFLVKFPTCIYAQYPDKNIKVIVHVSPGGGVDAMARLLLRYVGDELGISFIIENFKGAGGQLGYTTLYMAEPDGYTIGTITTTSIITHELTRKNVSYNIEDSFIPIARIVSDPSAIFVRTDSPIQTIEMLIEEARKKPDMISCGGSMIWGTSYIHYLMLEQFSDTKLNFIPFDGTAEARSNLLGGHVDVAIGGTTGFLSLIESGKVRALAVASEERLKFLPQVPTFVEKGFNVIIGSDRGLAAPANTPVEFIKLLSETINKVLSDPAFLDNAEKMKFKNVIDYLNSDDFKVYLLQLHDELKIYVNNSSNSIIK